MIRYIHRNNAFVSVTTRRANSTDIHFGKFTFWKSKKDYDIGDCKDVVTYTGVFLGNCEAYLPIEADKFIDNILAKGWYREKK
mgnify:CR=1 FL=1